MENQTIVAGLLKAGNWTGAIESVNFAWRFIQNTKFKLPLIVAANGVYDALLIFCSRHYLRQFFHSTYNLAGITATRSTHT